MKVVIAEKPSVAKDIAGVLGATAKNEGYLSGNGWAVTWAFGHLVELADPKEYGYQKWALDELPMIPDKFTYVLKNDAGAKKQFKVIRDLFAQADEIVCATDAGREGEAIFRYIYEQAKCSTPFKRLWISSLTKQAIKEGFDSLKPGHDYDALYRSAKARNEADWLVGMNATRALTLSAKAQKPLSVGRVQTPTLAIICNRFLENKNFKPTPYYKVRANLTGNGKSFFATCPDSFQDKDNAMAVLGKLAEKIAVSDKQKKEVTEKPPLPFDLTALQVEANRRYKFKAQKTLDVMQKLYEEYKMLTYPRTSSRYLGEDMIQPIREKVQSLATLGFGDALAVIGNNMQTFCFDSSKLTDHHAIIPTFENIDKVNDLPDAERKIFDLAVRQFLMALLPVCKKSNLSYKFNIDGEHFLSASGSTIIEQGWRMLANANDAEKDEKNDAEDDNQLLPDLQVGDFCDILKKEVLDCETKRPPLLSEATLLKAMETAGKMVDDDELAKAMKDCGLGTPATRAAIIETIFARGYVANEKNKLVPTELGLSVYNLVKNMTISNPSMTGDWESKLNKMAENSYDSEEFEEEIKEYTKKIVETFKNSGMEVEATNEIGKCPVCGKPIIEGQKGFGCSGYKEGCKFVIWKEIAGKKIMPAVVQTLLAKGETDTLKGFKSKDGKPFEAKLKFDAEHKVVFAFDDKPKEEKTAVGKCPLCGKDVFEGAKSFSCSGYKDGCQFAIWKEISGKKISAAIAKKLLANGETDSLKGFVSKAGKPFDAKLTLNADTKKVEFKFEK